MFSDELTLETNATTESHQKIQNPEADWLEPGPIDAQRPKRNCGHTGPTSPEGRAKSARNATTHGLCAETLILPYENEDAWHQLFESWLDEYQNPVETSVLYTFVLKTAQAEWQRRRAQIEFDYFFNNHVEPPIYDWNPEKIKQYELIQRYLTAAERRFQREYRLLEHHWKAHPEPSPQAAKPASKPQPEPEPPQTEMPEVLFINNETGEALDTHGNYFPPPPGYQSEPIIPGVYPPGHLAHPLPIPPKNGGRQR